MSYLQSYLIDKYPTIVLNSPIPFFIYTLSLLSKTLLPAIINFHIMEEHKKQEDKYIEISNIIEKQLNDIECSDKKKGKTYRKLFKKLRSIIKNAKKQLRSFF